MIPEYLNKVNSDKKAIVCGILLGKEHPTPSELLWLIKFLKFVGYSKSEIQGIIREHARWSDYSGRVASRQVEKVFTG